MINKYRFGRIEDLSCFDDGVTNIVYFPVTDSEDFPKVIRDKAKEMIDSMVHICEKDNHFKLDLSKLCLTARIIASAGNNGYWIYEIAVVISGNIEGFDEIWIERSYSISRNDPLYVQFKAYFMGMLEMELFR